MKFCTAILLAVVPAFAAAAAAPNPAAVAAEDAVRAALDMYKRHVPEAFEKRACPKNSVCYPDGYQSCMDSCQGGCPSFGCQIGCSGSCTDICSKC